MHALRILDDPPREPSAPVSDAWLAHHRYLIDVAYRMLGSLSEAEDIVQEAFIRLLRVEVGPGSTAENAGGIAPIVDVRGWLVVAVTRLCLDQLRSARARHEVYTGPWLPEPLLGGPGAEPDPAERVTLDDSVRMALLVVLERLTPAERAAFVLHDIFGFAFEDVANSLGRSAAACRQLASRARKRVQPEASPARFVVDPDELGRVVQQFITASAIGDLEALLGVLDPNVAGWTDTGGLLPAPRRPVAGREVVARTLLAFLQAYEVTLVPAPVNGEAGALAYQHERLMAVLTFSLRDGLLTQINAIANPHKLAYVTKQLARRAATGMAGTDAGGES